MEEFDIKKYEAKGFVIEHFPIHNFYERERISSRLWNYFLKILAQPMLPFHNLKFLIPLIELGFYHGMQNGYYFGFLATLTTYMIPIGFTGLVYSLYGTYLGTFNSHLTIMMACIISVWTSLFSHAWDKREKEMAFCFDVLDDEVVEEQRYEYIGDYVVDDITKIVKKEDVLNPFHRRFIVSIFNTNL